MNKTHFKSVDDYIAAQPKATQALLRQVRSTIRKAVPGGEEIISYNLPTYKQHGRPVICFAGWKEHYSIYGATDSLVAFFKDELAPYEVNDKGTIRFRLSEPVPEKVIERSAKFRAKQTAEPKSQRLRLRKVRALANQGKQGS